MSFCILKVIFVVNIVVSLDSFIVGVVISIVGILATATKLIHYTLISNLPSHQPLHHPIQLAHTNLTLLQCRPIRQSRLRHLGTGVFHRRDSVHSADVSDVRSRQARRAKSKIRLAS